MTTTPLSSDALAELIAAATAACEEVIQAASYNHEEDEVGVRVCCGVISYRDHKPDCYALRLQNALSAVAVAPPNATLPPVDKFPPRPSGYNDSTADPDSPLERWGKPRHEGSKLMLQPLPDGYWTPWHIANDLLRAEAALTTTPQKFAPGADQIIRDLMELVEARCGDWENADFNLAYQRAEEYLAAGLDAGPAPVVASGDAAETITDAMIAQWNAERDHGTTSAVGEYTPSEFWLILDELVRLRTLNKSVPVGNMTTIPEAVRLEADPMVEGIAHTGDWTIAISPWCMRVADERYAAGWNACRAHVASMRVSSEVEECDPSEVDDRGEYVRHCADKLEEFGLVVTARALRDIAEEYEALPAHPAASPEDLAGALRSIAEGNLGDQPWQANYDRIRQIARNALTPSTHDAPLAKTAREISEALAASDLHFDAGSAARAFAAVVPRSGNRLYSLIMISGVSDMNDTFIGWFPRESVARAVGDWWLQEDAKCAPEYREYRVAPAAFDKDASHE